MRLPLLLSLILFLNLIKITLNQTRRWKCLRGNGLFPHPYDCTKFISCFNGNGREMICPRGSYFNPKYKACDRFYKCKGHRRPTKPRHKTTTEMPDRGRRTTGKPWTTTRRIWPTQTSRSRRTKMTTPEMPGKDTITTQSWKPTTKKITWPTYTSPEERTTMKMTTPKREQTTSKPTITTPKLTITTPKPTITTPKPTITTPERVTDQTLPPPKPVMTTTKKTPEEVTTVKPTNPTSPTELVVTSKPTSSRDKTVTSPKIVTTLKPIIGNKVIVCYFSNWGWHRAVGGEFLPENINPYYCTHINYGFALLDANTLTIKVHDFWSDINNRFYQRVINLKKKNTKLKVLLSVGGWTESADDKYSRLANDRTARANFIRNAITFLTKHKFDGIDLVWMYPKCWQANCDAGPESDKSSFVELIKDIKVAFKRKNLLITAGVGAAANIIDLAYDVRGLGKHVDFLNVFAYDYHGKWENYVSHHAPLFARPESTFQANDDLITNVNFTVSYLIQKGLPPQKLVLGLPMYGRSYKLADKPELDKNKGFGMAASGGGDAGNYTKVIGFLAYYEICFLVKKNKWKNQRDPKRKVTFAYTHNQWVGYDDPKAIAEKANYIINMNLRGGMVWALDLDDFTGNCCGTKYPLLKTLNGHLRRDNSLTKITCV